MCLLFPKRQSYNPLGSNVIPGTSYSKLTSAYKFLITRMILNLIKLNVEEKKIIKDHQTISFLWILLNVPCKIFIFKLSLTYENKKTRRLKLLIGFGYKIFSLDVLQSCWLHFFFPYKFFFIINECRRLQGIFRSCTIMLQVKNSCNQYLSLHHT